MHCHSQSELPHTQRHNGGAGEAVEELLSALIQLWSHHNRTATGGHRGVECTTHVRMYTHAHTHHTQHSLGRQTVRNRRAEEQSGHMS